MRSTFNKVGRPFAIGIPEQWSLIRPSPMHSLVEDHARPLILAADDMARNARAIRLEKMLKRSGMFWGLAISSIAAKSTHLLIRRLRTLSANPIASDIKRGMWCQ